MRCVLLFDGASRGNPGQGGAGALLTEEGSGDLLWQGYTFCGYNVTNNKAEYEGLLLGLHAALTLEFDFNVPVASLTVMGDSQVVVRHMSGEYRCRSKNLYPLYQDACALETVLQCRVTYQHLPRKSNWEADELANDAVNTRKSWEEWACLNPPRYY